MTNEWHDTIDDSMSPEHLRLMLEGAGLEIFRVTGPSAPDGRYSATVRIQDAHYDGRAVRSGTGAGRSENAAIRQAVKELVAAKDLVVR